MSADRYSECPRCKAKRASAATAAHESAVAAYGKVSVDEYHALLAEADRLTTLIVQDHREYAFREDYEFSQPDEDGEITAIYSGWCSVESCGLRVKFEHTEPFDI